MSEEKISVSDQISNFNTYSVELRNRIEALLKQVLIVSGGIQTLTIGAFLGGKSPTLSVAAIKTLQTSWLSLSISVICCLSLMFLQIIAMVHVGIKQKNKLENRVSGFGFRVSGFGFRVSGFGFRVSGFRFQVSGIEVMNTWFALRLLNWTMGAAAFICCIAGVFFNG